MPHSLIKFSIIRWFYRSYYKLTKGKRFSHNKNLYPFIKCNRTSLNQLDDIYFEGKPINKKVNSLLKENNKPLVIFATGPSVKEISSDFFDSNKFDFIGVNGANEVNIQNLFKYYTIIDPRFIKNRFDIVKDILSDIKVNLFITPQCLFEVLIKISIDEIKCSLFIIENVLLKTYQPKSNLQDINKEWLVKSKNVAFSTHLEEGFFDGGTVAYTALQIALYLDYKEIYFVGLDMNNFDVPRFYEASNNVQISYLLCDYERIINSFELAAKLAKQNKVNIYNLSRNSAINSFEKKEIAELD